MNHYLAYLEDTARRGKYKEKVYINPLLMLDSIFLPRKKIHKDTDKNKISEKTGESAHLRDNFNR